VTREQDDASAGSTSSVRTRRRDIKAKTVVRDNISKLDAAIERLNGVKSRMCTQMVSGTKGNAAYDSAAVELDETVRKLQSVGLTT
jgi:division protein CdvB (Snf7/Vps24/ESCRT-III family)